MYIKITGAKYCIQILETCKIKMFFVWRRNLYRDYSSLPEVSLTRDFELRSCLIDHNFFFAFFVSFVFYLSLFLISENIESCNFFDFFKQWPLCEIWAPTRPVCIIKRITRPITKNAVHTVVVHRRPKAEPLEPSYAIKQI